VRGDVAQELAVVREQLAAKSHQVGSAQLERERERQRDREKRERDVAQELAVVREQLHDKH
jgi:hypothetical protein